MMCHDLVVSYGIILPEGEYKRAIMSKIFKPSYNKKNIANKFGVM